MSFIAAASAQTVRVVPWSTTLDDAIAEAKSGNQVSPSDFVIVLAPGTHTTTAGLGSNDRFTIRGLQDGSATLIGTGLGSMFDLGTGAELLLEGLVLECAPGTRLATITGSNASLAVRRSHVGGCSSVGNGGTIGATGTNATIVVDGSTLGPSSAPAGGHVHSTSGTVLIRGSKLIGGTASTANGGSVATAGALTIERSRLEGGTAAMQGGLVRASGALVISDSVLRDGVALQGGALYAPSPTVDIQRSVICGSQALRGGGIAWAPVAAGDLFVDHSLLVDNDATESVQAAGGAIRIDGTGGGSRSVRVQHSTLAGNIAASGSALGSNMNAGDDAVIESSILAYNQSTGPTVAESDTPTVPSGQVLDTRAHANTGTPFLLNFTEQDGSSGDPGFLAPSVGACDPLAFAQTPGLAGPIGIGGIEDADLDGAVGADDCDDGRPGVGPHGSEGATCNGRDDDCDGWIDDGVTNAPVWFVDADGDGFGDVLRPVAVCGSLPPGVTADGSDCDDSDPTIHPGAAEVCNNAVDEDCDGFSPFDSPWFPDADGDGFGATAGVVQACVQPDQHVAQSNDCDDQDPSRYPGAQEVCDGTDQDCDGQADELLPTVLQYIDGDQDGVGGLVVTSCVGTPGHVGTSGDCDDTDGDVFPGQDERCNGFDDDCDQVTDEPDAVDAPSWYSDDDDDGFGDPDSVVRGCSMPQGAVADDTDCDDDDDLVHPNATDVCNGVDDDCSGVPDDDPSVWLPWYRDHDVDGFGDPDVVASACVAPIGHVASADDCDDGNGATYPGAVEICDAQDNDCDGVPDDDAEDVLWYLDMDGDGFGVTADAVVSCEPIPNRTTRDGDCDDTDNTRAPGVPEVCDGVDQDCDGDVDEGLETTWNADDDGDGYGDPLDAVSSCEAIPGRVQDALDCDDGDPDVNPDATESCDAVDNDCDGVVDETFATTEWPLDEDGDGYPGPDTLVACARPPGGVDPGTPSDCDDTTSLTFPGAAELCDGVDQSCDGVVDEGFHTEDFWPDLDGDGFGDQDAPPVQACARPDGTAVTPSDCDDSSAAVLPGGLEICGNGLDDDCVGGDTPCAPRTSGCGCASPGAPTPLWGLVAVLAVRRRVNRAGRAGPPPPPR